MAKAIILAVAAVFAAGWGARTAQAQSTLLAGYDFQTTTSGGTAIMTPSSPSVYLANFGTQAGSAGLYLDGTHGSSTFMTGTTGNELTGATGSTLNAGTGFSATTTSPAALSLKGGTAESANGKSLVFSFSTTGYANLVLTFATQRSATGFSGNTLSYSTDGTNFTPFATGITPAASYAVVTEDFSAVPALNNVSTVYIEYTLAGATGTTGSNFLDNIQFNATPVPEPATYLGGSLLVGALVWSQRRRIRPSFVALSRLFV